MAVNPGAARLRGGCELTLSEYAAFLRLLLFCGQRVHNRMRCSESKAQQAVQGWRPRLMPARRHGDFAGRPFCPMICSLLPVGAIR